MPRYEGYKDEELYDDEVKSSYAEETDDDEENPKDQAFLKGYEEADNIDEDVEWEFDEEGE